MSECLFALEAIGSKLRFRFLPVMITRLILSLKKAATSQEQGWSLEEPTTHIVMRFTERQVATRDEMRLDTFASTRGGTQSQA